MCLTIEVTDEMAVRAQLKQLGLLAMGISPQEAQEAYRRSCFDVVVYHELCLLAD